MWMHLGNSMDADYTSGATLEKAIWLRSANGEIV